MPLGSIYVCNTSGNWSNAAIWTPTGVPGTGVNPDCVVLNQSVNLDVNNVRLGFSVPTQPTTAPTIVASGGGSVGGTLPTGTWFVKFTANSFNGETSASNESSQFTVLSGYIPRVTFGYTLPSGHWINLYATSGVTNTEKLFATGIFSATYDMSAPGLMTTIPPTGSAVSITASTRYLSINSGITLTLYGDLKMTGNVNMFPGSTLIFDSTSSIVPSSTNYVGFIGTANGGTARLIPSGTVNNIVIIKSNTTNGGANAYFTDSSFTQAGRVEAYYTNFYDLGTTSVNSFSSWCGSSNDVLSFQYCNFYRCGRVKNTASLNATNICVFDHVIFSGSIGATCIDFSTTNALTTGRRVATYSKFDIACNLSSPLNWDINNCIFRGLPGSTSQLWSNFSTNLIRITSQPGINLCGSGVYNTYFLSDHQLDNPHLITPIVAAANGIVSGCIAQHTGGSGNGDFFLTNNASGTWGMIYNLIIQNSSGNSTGTPFTLFGQYPMAIYFDHNTYFPGVQAAAVAETGPCVTGQLQTFRSNLAYDFGNTPGTGGGPNTNGPFKLWDSGHRFCQSTPTTDIVLPASADYNAGYGLFVNNSTGTGCGIYTTNSYACKFSSAPGVHDLNGVNPNFVDPTRNFEKYGIYRGWGGMVSGIFDNIMPSDVSDLLTWVKAGFVPTNPLYSTAAHDGGTIGAMPWAAATTSTIIFRRFPGVYRTGSRNPMFNYS